MKDLKFCLSMEWEREGWQMQRCNMFRLKFRVKLPLLLAKISHLSLSTTQLSSHCFSLPHLFFVFGGTKFPSLLDKELSNLLNLTLAVHGLPFSGQNLPRKFPWNRPLFTNDVFQWSLSQKIFCRVSYWYFFCKSDTAIQGNVAFFP